MYKYALITTRSASKGFVEQSAKTTFVNAIVWSTDGRVVQRSTKTTKYKGAVSVPTQTVHVYKVIVGSFFVCLLLSLFGSNIILSLNN